MAHLLKTFSVLSHCSWVKSQGPYYVWPLPSPLLSTPTVLRLSTPESWPFLSHAELAPFATVVPSAWVNCEITRSLISFKLQMFLCHRQLPWMPYRNRAIPFILFFHKLLFFLILFIILAPYCLFVYTYIYIRYKSTIKKS